MQNPDLLTKVEINSELKQWLVEYVGNKMMPENDEVTTEMVIHVLADEFPEVIMPLAEENYFRGYEQALTDIQMAEENTKQNAET
tara:strand:- start:725 stop:979 length:255 start_codon:yes stop_codon:yes gene_type:complete